MGQRGEFRGEYSLGVTKGETRDQIHINKKNFPPKIVTIQAAFINFPPGKITGADYKLYKNAGWGSDASPDVMATAMVQLDNSYEFPR